MFDDHDECYDEYLLWNVEQMKDRGIFGGAFDWRGVYTLEQAGLLVMGKNVYLDKLYVREGED